MFSQSSLAARGALPLLVAVSTGTHAQTPEKALPAVTVTATPFQASEHAQVLVPAKILAGDELRNKLGSSLGATLSGELGVSATGFGAAASRPVIRGMEGPRVKILQNGMAVSDVSAISNDHAVAAAPASARQIEILRGPAALLYGSGAVGGLVNVVDNRIPSVLEAASTGEAELRVGSSERARQLSLSVDGASGPLGLHLDGTVSHADDYKIPGAKILNGADAPSATLPWSYTRQDGFGVGASRIGPWGYFGTSVGVFNQRYGVPTRAGSQIDLAQIRYDVAAQVNEPFSAAEAFRFKFGYTDYQHAELDLSGTPETRFANRSLESRWELTHRPVNGWRGVVGVQTEDARFSALSAETGAPDTVPVTRSRSAAGFVVEEREFGAMRVNVGVRVETVTRRPVTQRDRSFLLTSSSLGALWQAQPGYGLGATLSFAQRAPSIEELFSAGPHDATGTFDRGDQSLRKETSRNLELTLLKTAGLVRWRANLFVNRVNDFVYGRMTGDQLDEEGTPGGDLAERIFSQADARIRGAEAEISYNLRGPGVSARGFADTSRATLTQGGNLPLQPSTRIGIDLGYRQGAWRAGMTLLRARQQARLATFETTPTPGYTQFDANLSYTQPYRNHQLTWFLVGKNLLNQDIRLSTSVLKDVAPQPARSLIVGLRTAF